MDELHEFCVRVVGAEEAVSVAEQAQSRDAGDLIDRLAAAAAICHSRGEPAGAAEDEAPDRSGDDLPLVQAVALEIAAATARMPQRHREVLALRELLGLSHEEISRVIGIDPTAIPQLLARARLRLRRELRGGPDAAPDCSESERSMRALARRQDGELSDQPENAWLLEHLGTCEPCTRAHAAMLEASVCYRAWRPDAGAAARS
jgi:Sigma-70, region 4